MSENSYDRTDRVRREKAIIAEGLKLAAYRLRDPETDEFGSLQYHVTYNNTVVAVMGEEIANLFCKFVQDFKSAEAAA